MHRRTVLLLSICLCAARLSVHAQEFKLFDRAVQVHGWLSQGLAYSSDMCVEVSRENMAQVALIGDAKPKTR